MIIVIEFYAVSLDQRDESKTPYSLSPDHLSRQICSTYQCCRQASRLVCFILGCCTNLHWIFQKIYAGLVHCWIRVRDISLRWKALHDSELAKSMQHLFSNGTSPCIASFPVTSRYKRNNDNSWLKKHLLAQKLSDSAQFWGWHLIGIGSYQRRWCIQWVLLQHWLCHLGIDSLRRRNVYWKTITSFRSSMSSRHKFKANMDSNWDMHTQYNVLWFAYQVSARCVWYTTAGIGNQGIPSVQKLLDSGSSFELQLSYIDYAFSAYDLRHAKGWPTFNQVEPSVFSSCTRLLRFLFAPVPNPYLRVAANGIGWPPLSSDS